MESAALARNGYSQATRQIKTPRSIEYDAFARVTSRIKAALPPSGSFPPLVAAMHDNRELWTILAADVADQANALPVSLKARIFYLAEFTFKHTGRVLAGEADPAILVEINSAMMAGLRDRSPAP